MSGAAPGVASEARVAGSGDFGEVAYAEVDAASVEGSQVHLAGVGKSQDSIHDAGVAFAKGRKTSY
jgi:hypothetical protein